jgi:hypothetical protein
MVTYFAKATATSAKTAQFQFRQSTVVTASASATATSTVSQADANQIAQQTAQQIADSTVENDANLMIQAVDTVTIGDTTFDLDSSFLSNYITQTGNNDFRLNASFTILPGKTLRIKSKQVLTIAPGVSLNAGLGFLRNNGEITLQNGGMLEIGDSTTNVASYSSTDLQAQTTPIIDICGNSINYGIITIQVGGFCIVNPNSILTNSTTGTINVSGFLLNYGTIQNQGTIQGMSSSTAYLYNGVTYIIGSTTYNPSANVSLNNSGTISGDFLEINSGNLDYSQYSYNIYNYNDFTVSGAFTNSSTITNGMLTGSTTPTTFTITNGGACINSGIITNNSNSSFSFSGTSFNSQTNIYISNSGTMTFNSSFTNSCNISNANNFTVNGPFTNSSPITNGFVTSGAPITFTITNGGTCVNTGLISNYPNSTFSFSGTSFTTNQNINNSGTMTFNSSFTSTGLYIYNYNTFNVIGAFTNSSTITNGMQTGSTTPTTFTITNGGSCVNSGAITNNLNSTFSFSGTSFTTSQGITNSGTITFNSPFSSTGSYIYNYGNYSVNGVFNFNKSSAHLEQYGNFIITNGGNSLFTGMIFDNSNQFSFTGTSFTIGLAGSYNSLTNSSGGTMYFYSSLVLITGSQIINYGTIKCSATPPYPPASPNPIIGITGPTGIGGMGGAVSTTGFTGPTGM